MILWCLVAGLTCFGFWCSSICMSNTAFTWPLFERATHRWCSCWQFDRGLVQWSIAVVLFVCHDDDHIPQRQVKRSAGHTCRRSCRPGTFHGSQRDGGVNGSCMEPLCGSVCSGICLSTLSRHIYESCRNSTGAGEGFWVEFVLFSRLSNVSKYHQNGHHYKVSKTSSQTSFSKKKRVFDAQDAYASIVLQCSVHRHRNLSSKIRNVQFFLFFQVFQGVPCNTCVRNLLMYENFNDDNIEYQPHSSGFFKK